MIILSDGKDEFIFYGTRETLTERFSRGFKVALYYQHHEIIRTLNGLYITRTN